MQGGGGRKAGKGAKGCTKGATKGKGRGTGKRKRKQDERQAVAAAAAAEEAAATVREAKRRCPTFTLCVERGALRFATSAAAGPDGSSGELAHGPFGLLCALRATELSEEHAAAAAAAAGGGSAAERRQRSRRRGATKLPPAVQPRVHKSHHPRWHELLLTYQL